MHLSKSTYQRSTPRTLSLCSWIAPGGQALVHAWQFLQNSSAPKRMGAVGMRGMSVVTPARRTPAPNCGLMRDPCLPSSPNPDAIAGGTSNNASAIGPGYACALYPCEHPVRKRVGCPCASGILIANVTHPDPIRLIRRNLSKPLVIVCKRKYDDPRLLNGVTLEDIQRIHRGNADCICLVRERERLHLRRKLLSRSSISLFRYRTELRVIVRSCKGFRSAGTLARALPCHNLQIAV